MRVINSVLELNKKLDSEIKLVWLEKPELNAPFEALFSGIGSPFTLIKNFRYFFFLKVFKHIYVNKYERFYRFFAGFFFDTIIFDSNTIQFSPEKLKGSKNILIATCYQFYPFDGFDNYVLNPEIAEQVENISRQLGDSSIGVHIRRTDHTALMLQSPLTRFYSKIEELNTQFPEKKIFLATDEEAVKRDLKERFPANLVTQETELSRNSEKGIIGAVIDIYCLAKTQTLVCNSSSSFAKTASLIGNPKNIIEV